MAHDAAFKIPGNLKIQVHINSSIVGGDGLLYFFTNYILMFLFYNMNILLFQKLHAAGLINDSSLQKVELAQDKQLFSLYWEIKTILYLGVLLLSGGIGILIYKNIDSIGHQAILLFIALVSASSFTYCFKKKLPFSFQKTVSPSVFFDYILLLGCLTFISFVGYIQFQYQVFGNRFGLATFIPMVVLFFSAYYFDQVGVLSLAITNLAAWAGIAATPIKILQSNDFSSTNIIITGVLLGTILTAAGVLTKNKKLKVHFEFTYTNFGAHILFISCLAAMFQLQNYFLLCSLLLVGISYFFYVKAVKEKSFYFLLILSIYGYIGLSYVVIRWLFDMAKMDIGGVYLAFIYFIVSAIGIILFLIKMNKKFKNI